MQETKETWIQSMDQEDPLEEEMATHSSIPAWKIPWIEEPGGLQSTRSQRVGRSWVSPQAWFLGFLGPYCRLVPLDSSWWRPSLSGFSDLTKRAWEWSCEGGIPRHLSCCFILIRTCEGSRQGYQLTETKILATDRAQMTEIMAWRKVIS